MTPRSPTSQHQGRLFQGLVRRSDGSTIGNAPDPRRRRTGLRGLAARQALADPDGHRLRLPARLQRLAARNGHVCTGQAFSLTENASGDTTSMTSRPSTGATVRHPSTSSSKRPRRRGRGPSAKLQHAGTYRDKVVVVEDGRLVEGTYRGGRHQGGGTHSFTVGCSGRSSRIPNYPPFLTAPANHSPCERHTHLHLAGGHPAPVRYVLDFGTRRLSQPRREVGRRSTSYTAVTVTAHDGSTVFLRLYTTSPPVVGPQRLLLHGVHVPTADLPA